MRNHLHSALGRSFLIAALSLGLALGCQSQPSNATPPQKTGAAPKTDVDPEPNPGGIELTPVGQGGGPKSDEGTAKPNAQPPNVPPIAVKKPTPKPKTTAPPSNTVPPTWTPPPLPSGWVWPFPASSSPPAGSTNPPPAIPTTLPPIGGS